MNQPQSCTNIWALYQAGADHHTRSGLYRQSQRCHSFFLGDQWRGAKTGGEELPVLNFIKPVCQYKIATVAMNDTAIVFRPLKGDSQAAALCTALTQMAASQWEKCRMDSLKWTVVKNACIAGDHYLYCYDARTAGGGLGRDKRPQLKLRAVAASNLYLADEQNPDLQEQAWLVLSERVPVAAARRQARQNGLPPAEVEKIVPDDDGAEPQARTQENDRAVGSKCTSLLYMEKTPDGLRFCRSTQQVIYQPMQLVPGLHRYPIAGMRWEEKPWDARGQSGVAPLIPNQIEVNKTLARRSIYIKRHGFPTAVVDRQKVQNAEDLAKLGATIYVDNLAGNPISTLVQYLAPPASTGEAASYQQELVRQSRELEGAGDAATGQVDPTKASGEAIKAARDQSALVLNEQSALFRQFVEDLALVWLHMWMAYSPDGLWMENEQGGQLLPAKALQGLEVDVRIDISPADPYSILARQLAMENALAAGHISFAEYVEALDASSGAPRDKFQAILQRRTTRTGDPDAPWPGEDGPAPKGEDFYALPTL